MESSQVPSVGFFPPRPTRLGEKAVFQSFAAALGNKKARAVWPPTLSWFAQNVNVSTARCLVGVSPAGEDVLHAQVLLGRLLALGVRRERVRLVLWNQGIPGGIAVEWVRQELGEWHAALPFDPSLLSQAGNRACALKDVNPRAPLARSVDKLAAEVLQWIERPPGPKDGELSDAEWKSLERRVAARLWESPATAGRERAADIDRALHAALAESRIATCPPALFAALRQRIHDDVMGLGPLESLMRDASLNEIMVNGVDGVFVEKNGALEKSGVAFASETQLKTVIDRVVGRMGRRVDLSSPLCDVRLPDGSRVNVVLPPLSLAGPVMTIRRFKPLYQTPADLEANGTMTAAQSARLREAVLRRKNILVAGNSGAGKTTLLNVLAGLIPPEERIITLEDAAELQIRQPHVVRLETRPKSAEGTGEVAMSDLVVNALRMRPDRLVIGECRGAEVVPMIQAMNTGHDGSMTTIHANSAADALRRLESLVLLHAPEWSLDVVKEQIKAGINLVIFLRRQGGERKLLEILDV